MEKFLQIINEIRVNPSSEVLCFTLHRVTGAALVIFLLLHIWTLSSVFQGPVAFDKAVGKFNNPVGHLMEYTLLLTVFIHLLNGLRITLVELFDLTSIQRGLMLGSVGILILVAVYSYGIFF
jgi:succinate dehydrogenase cytochrome b556 subunit